jgi:cytidylate kinase
MTSTVIAIDGPAGSGKSTLARRLAVALQLPYINTGLMYRALALRALREGVGTDDEVALTRLVASIRFDLDITVEPPQILIDAAPPEAALTSQEVESTVSLMARHPEVRDVMRREQRRLGERGAVMEGRDIGSVVFPDALVRIHLEASSEARAARRALERDTHAGHIERTISERDRRDARNVPPVDSDVVIDTTDLDPDAALDVALREVRRRMRGEA